MNHDSLIQDNGNERDDYIGLGTLPAPLLLEIVEFLPLNDGRSLFQSCCALWRQAAEIESRRRTVKVGTHQDIRLLQHIPYLQNYNHILCLDLGRHATDSILGRIASQLPVLQELSMVESLDVYDSGLATLGHSDTRRQHLRSIDITFCTNITYETTLQLRLRLLHPDVVIRRQPVWMDGHFETPFENDGLHTYWADGSFSFQRAEASCGFIRCLRKWDAANPDHIGDRLQFANFQPPATWPPWAGVFYRPGVSLLRLPYEDETESRTVLVAQAMKGIYPPALWPKREHGSLPIGVTKFFDHDGTMLSLEDEADAIGTKEFMVTRMRVRPLECLMPPKHIVDQNQTFLDINPGASGRDDPNGMQSDMIHRVLGGTIDASGTED